MTALLLILLGLPLLLLLLYAIGVQYERKGIWYLALPVTMVALGLGFILDVLLNYTLLAAYLWSWPQRGEYTFSLHLKRLQHSPTWRGPVARLVVRVLNYFAPNGDHVL